ncbi:hypothetical protein [Desulfobacula sp.]|uniref:hypothetical protein n=1 Tax=Desulfobacula sp. TaxID=2593537 RepID=UPI002602609F|nr:hypothetical protein [Desulfobacula sp.]
MKTKPLLELVNKPWENFLDLDVHASEIEVFRKHERTGRPLGVDSFIDRIELLLDRKLKPEKPGPKKKDK